MKKNSLVRRKPCQKAPLSLAPGSLQDLGYGDFFSFMRTAELCVRQMLSLAALPKLRHEGVGTRIPLSQVGLRRRLLYKAVLCQGQDGEDLTLCALSSPGSAGRPRERQQVLPNKCCHANRHLSCPEELIRGCLGIESKQEKGQGPLKVLHRNVSHSHCSLAISDVSQRAGKLCGRVTLFTSR